jgi:acetyl esterase/lipase
MDRALASSGLLVVAIDMTVAPDTPYPACAQDANYGVRWLKANAPKWNGDTFKIGIYGSSSGGHVAELIAMRPHDPRYSVIPLEAAPNLDATVPFIATRSPISNTVARYENAEKRNRAGMTKNNKTFFNPRETIQESNPQKFLDREEKITFVPFLIVQGALDDNMPPEAQEQFAKSYQAAGGNIEFLLFETHGRASHRLADRLSVSRVVLVALDVCLHILRRHQPHLVTELRQLPRPIVRRGAGLHADETRQQRLEERQHLAASESLPHDDLLGRVDPVNLEHVLGDIQPDRGNLHVDGSPHVIRLRRSRYGTPRCRERAPSTKSEPAKV